jgi:hypothetical protein
MRGDIFAASRGGGPVAEKVLFLKGFSTVTPKTSTSLNT